MDGLPQPQAPHDEPRADSQAQLLQENARLRQDLEGARARIDLLSKELETFSGRIAHDLQAVMQVTEGFATALQRGAAQKLSDKERHYLQRIVDTSVRGNRLVNDLMAFARLGIRPIKFAPVDLGHVLQRARRTLDLEAPSRNVEWVVGDLPTVWGDAALLETVLVNLLTNALKFSTGRDPACIRIDAAPIGQGSEIRIQDNGVGFDPEYADRLFHPFERLHGSDQFDGNGMGLATVRRIVERHGGAVRAEGRPGVGALFAFTLPEIASSIPAKPEPAGGSTGLPPGALRVLVVDDDPMVLLSLRNMLEIDGHEVSTAAGGLIGVEAFERSLRDGPAYDVVITDFGMPHMDGGAVARRVKQASPHTVVIMLSGWQQIESMVDWKADVDTILHKPPRLVQLRQALARAQGRGDA